MKTTTGMLELLRVLWPEPPADGYLTIWEMPGKSSLHYPIRDVLSCSEADVRELLAQLEGHNVYFGHGLRCPGLPSEQRGTKKHVNWIPGYVLDIDLFNPDNPKAHKLTNSGGKASKEGLRLPETDEDVDAITEGAPPPTAIVHTGNGYHFYWGFDKPQQLTCKAARDAAHKHFEAFQEPFIERARGLGFHLDKTATIERVWRLPGSRNEKKT